MKKPKPCSIRGCPRNQRAKGLCSAHYQAIIIRKTPLEDVLELDMDADRLRDAVRVQTRIEREDLEKLEKAIAAGKVKETRYTFLQRAISDAIGDL